MSIIEKQAELISKIDMFLDINNYEAYLQALKTGYPPTEKQKLIFENILYSYIKNQDYQKISDIISNGYSFNSNDCLNYISHNFLYNNKESFIFLKTQDRDDHNSRIDYLFEKNKKINQTKKQEENNKKSTFNILDTLKKVKSNTLKFFELENEKEYLKLFVQDYILQQIYQNDNQEAIYKNILELFKKSNKKFFMDMQSTLNIPLLFRFLTSEFVSKQGLNTFLNNLNTLKTIKKRTSKKNHTIEKMYEQTISSLENKSNLLFPDLIDNVVLETKLLYIKENALIEAKESEKSIYNSITINNFPEKIINDINLIQELYLNILKSSPNQVASNSVQYIVEQKLSKIISHYLLMQPEYRISMYNSQGKNSEDLLHESLIAIKETLTKELKDHQFNNLSELSVQNRLMTKISKSN